jgi:hypothetical protein
MSGFHESRHESFHESFWHFRIIRNSSKNENRRFQITVSKMFKTVLLLLMSTFVFGCVIVLAYTLLALSTLLERHFVDTSYRSYRSIKFRTRFKSFAQLLNYPSNRTNWSITCMYTLQSTDVSDVTEIWFHIILRDVLITLLKYWRYLLTGEFHMWAGRVEPGEVKPGRNSSRGC